MIQQDQKPIRSQLIVAATGLGKAQPLYESILTPSGWLPMWQMREGMEVYGADGKPTTIRGVYPQGTKTVFRLFFNDKAHVDCCEEHLWSVQTKSMKSRGGGFVTRATSELVERLRDASGACKWFLPVVEPVQFAPTLISVDPYVIGAFIGDGGYAHSFRFSTADSFIVSEIQRRIPCTWRLRRDTEYDYSLLVGHNRGFSVGSEIRQVLGRQLSHEKRLPHNYLYNSVAVRTQLLQGLMDTDGYVSKDGHCEFTTVSRQLADDVCELVRSLGGVTRVRNKAGSTYTYAGELRTGRESFSVTVNLPFCPFLLPRKAARWIPQSLGRTKSIVGYEVLGKEECQCIAVESPRRLYLTSGYTLTHNTVIMGGLAKSWPTGRVMLMSHRFELNQQAMNQLQGICSEEIDLEQASFWADQRTVPHRIVVASVQTLNSFHRKDQRYRFERFDPSDFGLLMIDEAHRATASTYRRVIEHFRSNPDLCVVGVTATPDRLDKVGMGCVFETVACDLNIKWAVDNGWLVPPQQKFVKVDGLDLSAVRTIGGDLDEKQLAKLVEMEQNLHAMAKPIVDVCGVDKQAIVFTASVKQAHRIAEMIRDYHGREHGGECKAVALDGSMPPQDPVRRQIVSDFKNGEIQYLCNCGVATEGFDAPSVRVVAIGRPTKSRALYQQMLGRGTRALPGVVDGPQTAEARIEAIKNSDKPFCTVIDFLGQAGRHKLVCSTDFMAGKADPPEVVERANRISSHGDFDGSTLDALREARAQLEAEKEARRAKVTVGVSYELMDQNTPYDLSVIPKTSASNFMRRYRPSDKQKSMLLKLGYTSAQIEQIKSMAKASAAIDYAINNPRNSFGLWMKQQANRPGKGRR